MALMFSQRNAPVTRCQKILTHYLALAEGKVPGLPENDEKGGTSKQACLFCVGRFSLRGVFIAR